MNPQWLIVLLSFLIASASSSITGTAVDYLTRFNYFGPTDLSSGQLRTQSSLEDAIRRFQKMNGLEETGIMTSEVERLMAMPRCGLPDYTGTQAIDRTRRYALADIKWHKNEITWRLENDTPDLARSKVREIMAKALKHWADASRLSFREISSGNADIMIKFARMMHNDGNPFDGQGSILAHAYFPTSDRGFSIAGDAHFDDDEDFTDGTSRGSNLFQVAVHELGHSLGLGHSTSPHAIMAPIYRGYQPDAKLHKDDIAGIQALYGADSGMPEVTGTEGPTSGGRCGIANFVAAAQTRNQGSYLFNDTHAFEMDLNGLVGNPRPISAVFPGIPSAIDAAFYYAPSGKTYFFKGAYYWRTSDFYVDTGYPRRIHAGFGALPNDLDAAFVWSGNGMTYFVKGNKYWRFNFRTATLDRGYPKSLTVWNGIGTKVDAAFQFENKATYFFTGGEYRRFDDNRFTVAETYPRSATMWLRCDAALVAASNNGTNTTVATNTTTAASMTTVDTGGSGCSVISSLAVILASVGMVFSCM